MKTLKHFVASTLLALALVAGTVADSLAQTVIDIYECTLVATVIDYDAGTVTDIYECELKYTIILY